MDDKQTRIAQLYSARANVKAPIKPELSKAIAYPTPAPEQALKPLEIKGLPRPLFPFQEIGTAFVESRGGNCIIGDDMGTGKSIQSLAYLQYHKEDRPAIIICPASIKLNWCKEVFATMEKCKENSVYILSGKTNKTVEEVYMTSSGRLHLEPCSMPKTGIFIINYDVVVGWMTVLLKLKAKIVIADEAQYLRSRTTARTKSVSTLVKPCPKFLALTGTLIENRPSEAYPIISLVAPELFPSWWLYAQRYCAPKKNAFGWDFKGASNIPELFLKLRNVMIRRLKSEVLKDLPPKIKSVVPLEIDNRSEYIKAETNLIKWIKENKGKLKADQASKIEALARINQLKELCTAGKLESCLDWIEDYLADGSKLVVFCTRTATLNRVYSEFKEWAVMIDGSVTGEQRDKAVTEFQNNPKIKLMVGNVIAAGVGLTLTASSTVCFLELPWSPSQVEQASDRCHRIGQTDTVNVYFLVGSDTIDIEIAELLDSKSKVVNAILNGTDIDCGSLMDGLIKGIEEK